MSAAEIDTILQSHQEGVSLRGISRISGRAIGTVTDIVKQTAQRSQMIHNQEVSEVEVESIAADEMWSFVEKNKLNVCQKRK